MATFTLAPLSGSTDGKPIIVSGTATGSANTLHTADANPTLTQIYVWASNTSGTAALLTIEFGGVTDPDNHIVKQVSIPPNSPPIPIITGQLLRNSLLCKAFAGVTNVINVTGYVIKVA